MLQFIINIGLCEIACTALTRTHNKIKTDGIKICHTIKVSKLHLNTANFAYWQMQTLRLLVSFHFVWFCVDMKAACKMQFSSPTATWFKFQFNLINIYNTVEFSFHQIVIFLFFHFIFQFERWICVALCLCASVVLGTSHLTCVKCSSISRWIDWNANIYCMHIHAHNLCMHVYILLLFLSQHSLLSTILDFYSSRRKKKTNDIPIYSKPQFRIYHSFSSARFF